MQRIFDKPGEYEFVVERSGRYHVVLIGGGGCGTKNGHGAAGWLRSEEMELAAGDRIRIVVGGPGEASCFGEVTVSGGFNRFGGEVVSHGGIGVVIVENEEREG